MRDTDLNQLYSRQILDLAASIDRTDPLTDADASARVTSPVCGSRIEVSLNLTNGRISDYGQKLQACALGQASAAIMARHVIGSDRVAVEAALDDLDGILAGKADADQMDWPELALLAPVHEFPARHGAVRLPFLATLKALDSVTR
ncbi:MAG: iron-sulfur cluster assembly scaffold protein [Alphaproteobacteria bacterium]|nr:iron-sulfur cluster assembly scaffold protein [Alphaproteobacteria bacterium SS10]